MSKAPIIVRLPKLGESILSAKIVGWFKKVGDYVKEDEPLVEVATDKVNSEIPSPIEGVIQEILAQVDEEVEVGAPLLSLASLRATDVKEQKKSEPEAYHLSESHSEQHEATQGFLSPAVLHLARERKIPLEELERIRGTGQGGRVTKRDVELYQSTRLKQTSISEDVERIPMSPMRKAISDNMTRSFYTAPHAYLVSEVDVTDLLSSINRQREEFFAEHQVKLTITSFVIRAIGMAVAGSPLVNASVEGEVIVRKKEVNIGIAVAIDDGLVVPVIKQVQGKSIADIAKTMTDLSLRARSKKLTPDEVSGGSITLTNFGMAGAMIGFPIIRYPEVAIIGLGAIQKRVMVLESGYGVRDIVHATLAIDHRALDGMYAGKFLKDFKEALEGMR
ncbi:MAG: 2-oxo acid dehydrogenase subunit E2 [Verrucomicrobia bacterium]|nr:2-oxo acid dehydrogenase subunit E2 [Verrucomicrobiota bacterium]